MSFSGQPAENIGSTRVLRGASRRADGAADAPGSSAGRAAAGRTLRKEDLSREDLTGFSFGHYDLGQRIGRGGMGTVYTARHRHLDRLFAIKFVASEIADSSEAQYRFEQEMKALGSLQHPQIVNAVDAGCHDGLSFLVTELVDGETLAELTARRGPLPVDEACHLIRQTAAGLAYSHSRGFIHRDIKPSNLMLGRDGVVRILDFGLVRSERQSSRRTEFGDTLGTWDYLAPEQAHDASTVDHRADLYSLGCTFLTLLSGDVPFSGERFASPAARLKGHLFDKPTWLQNPPEGVSAELLAVLNRMVAKPPEERYQSASEVEQELAKLLPATNRYDADASPEKSTSVIARSSGRRSVWLRSLSCALAVLLLITAATWRRNAAVSGDSVASASEIPSAIPSSPAASSEPSEESSTSPLSGSGLTTTDDSVKITPSAPSDEKIADSTNQSGHQSDAPETAVREPQRKTQPVRVTQDTGQVRNASPPSFSDRIRSSRQMGSR